MTVLQSSEENETHFILFWYSNKVDDTVENPNGVGSEHVTKIITGDARVDFDNGQESQILTAGNEITLPTKVGYTFEVLANPTEIQCFYPHGEAADEVKTLATPRNAPRIWENQSETKPEDWSM